jgi:hypothetical protein
MAAGQSTWWANYTKGKGNEIRSVYDTVCTSERRDVPSQSHQICRTEQFTHPCLKADFSSLENNAVRLLPNHLTASRVDKDDNKPRFYDKPCTLCKFRAGTQLTLFDFQFPCLFYRTPCFTAPVPCTVHFMAISDSNAGPIWRTAATDSNTLGHRKAKT